MLEQAPAVLDEEGDDDDGEQRSFLGIAIKAVVQIMRWRILHAANDEIGVMFYGAVSCFWFRCCSG